jgi:hypothetical protein
MKDSLYHYQFSCSQAYTDISPEDLFQRYLNLLEEKAKLYPYQWYNFYPFGKIDTIRNCLNTLFSTVAFRQLTMRKTV